MSRASIFELCKDLLSCKVQNIQPLDFKIQVEFVIFLFQTNDPFLTKDSIFSSIVKYSVPYYQSDITMVFVADKKLSADQVR